MPTITYQEVLDAVELMRKVESGTYVVDSGDTFSRILPHVRLQLVSIATDRHGVVRAKLLAAGATWLRVTQANIAPR